MGRVVDAARGPWQGCDMDREDVIKATLPLFRETDFILRAALFGSFARSNETEASDVDVLVDVGPETSLLALEKLRLALEDVLGRHVDVVSRRGLKSALLRHVLADQLIFYEKG